MQFRTVHNVKITLPGHEPDDLDVLDRIPRDAEPVIEQVITGDVLARANLTRTKIVCSWLTSADLSSASFRHVTLDRCVLTGCTLIGARFDTVAFNNVIFENCRLDYATFHNIKTPGPVGFVGCSLAEATFSGSSLTAAIFDGCKLSGLDIDRCDLYGADLRGNDLTGLTSATALRGATISESQVAALAGLLLSELSITVATTPSDRGVS